MLTTPKLIQELSTIVDPALAQAAVESYVEMQQRFLAGDWKPAELDGGRLCEAIARCLYQLDTGAVTHSKLPNDICTKLEDQKAVHVLAEKERHHLVKVIQVIYKFRSDRGPVHISPIYDANYMDSMMVLHVGKWLVSEFLRVAWNQDRQVIAETIDRIVQLEHSLIHELNGKPLVLAKGIPAPDEVLLLLNHATGNKLSRSVIREQAANQKSATVNAAIVRLIRTKDIRPLDGDEVALTPRGQVRIMKEIIPKWVPYK
jgi:molybdopterin converting factor small subunit